MPLEPNPVTVGALLVAIVVATIGGGLIGRRLRTWNERRVARRAVATLAARQSLPAAATTEARDGADGRAPSARGRGERGMPQAASYLPAASPASRPRCSRDGPPACPPPSRCARAGPSPRSGRPRSRRRQPHRRCRTRRSAAGHAGPDDRLPPARRARRRAAIAVALAAWSFALGAGLGIVAGRPARPVRCSTRRARPARRTSRGGRCPATRAPVRRATSIPPDETEAAARLPVVAAGDATRHRRPPTGSRCRRCPRPRCPSGPGARRPARRRRPIPGTRIRRRTIRRTTRRRSPRRNRPRRRRRPGRRPPLQRPADPGPDAGSDARSDA